MKLILATLAIALTACVEEPPSNAATPIPEPGTMLLFGIGAIALGIVIRKRK